MKIYTKTGDAGTTGLFGGPRVSKASHRICAYGEIDELNAMLGAVRAYSPDPEMDQALQCIQSELFSIGAELACQTPEEHALKWKGEQSLQQVENWIDQTESQLSPLKNFILPGGSPLSAHLHLARTICRRAEREIVALNEAPDVSDLSRILVYLNRLSDLFFVFARFANQTAGIPDSVWQKPSA